MEELKDYIFDAYYYKKGQEFGRKVRRRIHWITSNISGEEILDVGCSQGITPILLGREGKKVLGIDSSHSAIEDAKRNLSNEDVETQKNVEFREQNFFSFNSDHSFDTVILGEVLEHITDEAGFIQKAKSIVKEKGKVIVTTPFGINDFVDHKKTFYISDFIKLQQDDLRISNVEYLDGWIGIIFEKTNEIPLLDVSQGVLDDLEMAFYEKERKLLDKLNKRTQDGYGSRTGENYNYKQKFLNEKIEKVKTQNELYVQYKKEKATLKEFKRIQKEYESLLKKYKNLEKKYRNLSKSKLGKLTLLYWKLRRRG
ncbi:class I SAM-dependent methyltransferase [Oceanobacillus salinisoli]|uniref:class I SAM-dependent methyltransferase n=1 Tax=Oceanobacillus salinisoli TaxID=2678611 RepID=UPI0018CC0E3A|nr:methyltransferase domain-containing protein [Oceanobacillus salinisoli]